jgi:hypothetical protein
VSSLFHFLFLFLSFLYYTVSVIVCQYLEPCNVVRLDHSLEVSNLERILGNLPILDKIDNLSISNHCTSVVGNLNRFHFHSLFLIPI